MILPATTSEQVRNEIVKFLKGLASNHRIAAAKASRVATRIEQTTMGAALQGAADMIERAELK